MFKVLMYFTFKHMHFVIFNLSLHGYIETSDGVWHIQNKQNSDFVKNQHNLSLIRTQKQIL